MDKQLIVQLLIGGSIIWLAFLVFSHIEMEKRNGKSIKYSTKESTK